MKITNLRPKDGASVILDKDGHAVLFDSDGHVVVTLAEEWDMEHLEFDVVQPEYKVGDVVEILDGTYHITRKGFIYNKTESEYHVAIKQLGITSFSRSSGNGYFSLKIVGLWLEGGKTK